MNEVDGWSCLVSFVKAPNVSITYASDTEWMMKLLKMKNVGAIHFPIVNENIKKRVGAGTRN